MIKLMLSAVWQLAVGIGVLLEISIIGSWTAGRLDASGEHVLMDIVIIAFVTGLVGLPAWALSRRRV